MERPRLALITLMCVLFSQKRISGEEVELKVKPGENVTLYCDRALTTGKTIVWIRNCSHKFQPSLEIKLESSDLKLKIFEHFIFIYNSHNKSLDLYIPNISESDVGLYYCAAVENKVNKDEKGIISGSPVYYYGNRTTRLTLEETSCSVPLNITPAPPPVSDCVSCWTLLFSVCPLCVLLFSICVYCLCQKKSTDASTDQEKLKGRNTAEDGELCYTSVNLVAIRQEQRKTKRVQCSDFSTYAQVRTETE